MSIELAQQIIAITPMLGSVEKVEYLDKGFSTEKKYVLWEGGAPVYLLRLGEVAIWQRRQADFGIMRQHHQRGVLCSEPHLSGVTEDGTMCYLLLGYIPGRNAEDALPDMTEDEQHEIGFAAGRELRKLHELAWPDEKFDWAAHRKAKYRRRVEMLQELGLTFVSQCEIEEYVEDNQRLLDEAPVCFQHDDFHPANLIVHEGKLAGVIDFNRCDWGDPWEDFYKLPWFGVPISIPFARGQVQGYFAADGLPQDFWKKYNLYVAMSLHGSLVWVLQYYPDNLGLFQRRIREIVDTHDFVYGGPPSWFADPPSYSEEAPAPVIPSEAERREESKA